MNTTKEFGNSSVDPLGLRDLPAFEPPEDGWPEIRQSLTQNRRRRLTQRYAGLAMVASILAAVLLITRISPSIEERPVESADKVAATTAVSSASDEREQTLGGLITMSQTLEQQLRDIRDGAGPMPASSSVYVAELEDLVAQVDNELSISPNSVNLWGQRVNLLLDLAQLYQQQWEREYGRMASL